MAKDTSGARRRWTEIEARAALDELARSGQSELAFARTRGFSRERLRYWKSQLGVSAKATNVSPKPTFVAVAMPVAARTPAKIEIHVGALSVCVREDLDVEHVARIVDALARVREC
jgi:hypothetical protein